MALMGIPVLGRLYILPSEDAVRVKLTITSMGSLSGSISVGQGAVTELIRKLPEPRRCSLIEAGTEVKPGLDLAHISGIETIGYGKSIGSSRRL